MLRASLYPMVQRSGTSEDSEASETKGTAHFGGAPSSEHPGSDDDANFSKDHSEATATQAINCC